MTAFHQPKKGDLWFDMRRSNFLLVTALEKKMRAITFATVIVVSPDKTMRELELEILFFLAAHVKLVSRLAGDNK